MTESSNMELQPVSGDFRIDGPTDAEQNIIADIAVRLEQDPKLADHIRTLFTSNLATLSSSGSVFAVRSNDVLSVLQELTGPVELMRADSYVGKQAGFYMEAMPNHPYFQQRPDILLPSIQASRPHEVLNHNSSVYGRDIPFLAAFYRNVVPHLTPDWYEKLKLSYKTELNEGDMDIEDVINALHMAIQNVNELHISIDDILSGKAKHRIYHHIPSLSSVLINQHEFSDILAFLLHVDNNRAGVMTGYSEAITTGNRVMTWPTSNDIVHMEEEVVVVPTTPTIDTRPAVVGCESLGAFEDQVLDGLGLL